MISLTHCLSDSRLRTLSMQCPVTARGRRRTELEGRRTPAPAASSTARPGTRLASTVVATTALLLAPSWRRPSDTPDCGQSASLPSQARDGAAARRAAKLVLLLASMAAG